MEVMQTSVFPGLNPAQFKYAVEVAKALQLNPLKGELHMLATRFKDGNHWRTKITPYVPLLGYLSVAQRSKELESIETVWIDENNQEHEVLPPGARLHAAKCTVKRTGHAPVTAVVYWDEMGGPEPRGNWAKMPRHMLAKCAKARALREEFIDKLGGTMSQEELEAEHDLGQNAATFAQAQPENPRPVRDAPQNKADEARRAVLVSTIKEYWKRFEVDEAGNVDHVKLKATISRMQNPGPVARKWPVFQDWTSEQLEELADVYAAMEYESEQQGAPSAPISDQGEAEPETAGDPESNGLIDEEPEEGGLV
jgi:phage recombination protein Bet